MSMTTINKVIERVDAVKPNTFDEEMKTAWLAQLDGMIQKIVMQKDELIEYKYPEDMDRELLVPFPFEDIYVLWLSSKIDFQNQDYDEYNNSAEAFNNLFADFKKAYIREHMPKQATEKGYWGW